MSWGKLDDQLHRNEKQLAMSDAAFRVWICSWSLAHDLSHEDGFLPTVQATALVRSLGKSQRAVRELVRLNAWEEVDGGWLIHDFGKYSVLSGADRARRYRNARRHVDRHAEVTPPSRESNARAGGNPSSDNRYPGELRDSATSDPGRVLTAPPQPSPARARGANTNSEAIPSPKARRILETWLGLSGRGQFSQSEMVLAEEFAGEFQALSDDRAAERMREHWSACESNGWAKPRSLRGFTQTLRLENDHASDTQSQRGRPASAMTRIGDVLP